MLQAFTTAREAEGGGPCQENAASGARRRGGGRAGAGEGRRGYKGPARGPAQPGRTCARRSLPREPRDPRALGRAAVAAACVARDGADGGRRLCPSQCCVRRRPALPVPEVSRCRRTRTEAARARRFRRNPAPCARSALRPPGRPETGRGPAGGAVAWGPEAAGPRAPAAAHGERAGQDRTNSVNTAFTALRTLIPTEPLTASSPRSRPCAWPPAISRTWATCCWWARPAATGSPATRGPPSSTHRVPAAPPPHPRP